MASSSREISSRAARSAPLPVAREEEDAAAAAARRGWPRPPPWLLRLLVRSLFLGSQVFVAQLLLSGEGDRLIAVQSLIGAIGMTAFTYFLPYVLLIALAPVPLGAGRLAWMTLNIAAGLIVMFAGLASSVEELYSSSSGFFDGECRLEYTYSPESPDDPCFLSGLPHEAGR